jgi:hypothetical protein
MGGGVPLPKTRNDLHNETETMKIENEERRERTRRIGNRGFPHVTIFFE